MADKAMRQTAHSLRSNFKASALDDAIKSGDIEIYHRFDNGYALVRLKTPTALEDESAQLGHCIGDGAYDEHLENPNTLFLSLRDPNNVPHATLEVRGNELRQMKGKENGPPIEKYSRILHPFLRQSDWVLKESPIYTGLIDYNGEKYDAHNAPDDYVYHHSGELDLLGTKWLKKILFNLQVEGSFNLEGCSNLTTLPNSLSVGEYLNLSDCVSLQNLPKDLNAREISLVNCRSLTFLPAGLTAEHLDLHGCRNLIALPAELSIDELLEINLDECPNLIWLPKRANVGRIAAYQDKFTRNSIRYDSWPEFRDAFYKARPHLDPDAPPPSTANATPTPSDRKASAAVQPQVQNNAPAP